MRLTDRAMQHYKRLLKLFSRTEWLLRLLNLPHCSGTGTHPGLVLIQVDGLSRTQFQRALSRRRLPFMHKLLKKRGFVEKPFYSGLPSSTPAVQAELFYGIKTAVPSFEFIDRKTGERHAMFHPASANEMARQLQVEGIPLLEGGSAYSTVFSGGAQTARYCAETMNLPSLLTALNPLRLALLILFHITKMIRIVGYAIVELCLAVYDFLEGVIGGENFIKELKFIPTRLFVCVILRELIRFRMKMDIARGIPIVGANFLGYDEQAHRRGPGSAFAHWTLKGIDGAVKDIYQTALRSDCRDYRIVIFSDHGQESVETFADRFDKPLKEVLRKVLSAYQLSSHSTDSDSVDSSLDYSCHRAASLFFKTAPRPRQNETDGSGASPQSIEITTMGPLGHIYLPDGVRETSDASPHRQSDTDSDSSDLERMARLLNEQADIPLVLYRKNGTVVAVNDSGSFELENNPGGVLGSDHPFLEQVAEDLNNLCRHPNAGDLVISGYRPGGTPYSFSSENGAHGGPGKEETRGFVLLPPAMKDDRPFLRPLDLRNRILAYMGKANSDPVKPAAAAVAKQKTGTRRRLRIITYNIHSCIHMDGRINPDRTADVMAELDPDIAMLQEVDVNRARTHFIHQGDYLAERLGLACRFFPVMENCGELYGLAILSRYPFLSSECVHFPDERKRRLQESRGAMLAAVDTPLGAIRVVNTHLGLHRDERRRQVAAILQNEWVRQPLRENTPLIVGGDLNAGARSIVYRQLAVHLSDIQMMIEQKGFPKATFFSRYPIFRLDHIFISEHFRPVRVMVPNGYEARLVSDHLPLYCELVSAPQP